MKQQPRETAASILNRLRELGEEDLLSPIPETRPLHKCENCGKETSEVAWVPILDYLGCYGCYDGAMEQLQTMEKTFLAGKLPELVEESLVREIALFFKADCDIDEWRAYKRQLERVN